MGMILNNAARVSDDPELLASVVLGVTLKDLELGILVRDIEC